MIMGYCHCQQKEFVESGTVFRLCARLNIGVGLQNGIIHCSYPQRTMICYTEVRSKIFHTIHLGKIIER